MKPTEAWDIAEREQNSTRIVRRAGAFALGVTIGITYGVCKHSLVDGVGSAVEGVVLVWAAQELVASRILRQRVQALVDQEYKL